MSGCTKVSPSGNVTEQDAISFVLDDLKVKYPDAEIREVAEISKSDDSWYVKARVTYNYSTPCPVRMHLYYDYPKKGFIISPSEYVTKECKVCQTGTCIIGTPEEAIIASHTLNGTETVANYIFYHSDAKPDAKFYAEYISNGVKNKNVWIVKWFSQTTNYGIFAMVSNEGQVLKTWEVAKTEIPA
jgi:hypothetical protein